MRRVAIWILMALLVASGVYALGVQARRMADRNALVYTDGRSIQVPKSEAPVRSILWTSPLPMKGGLNTGDEEYHPALSPDGASLFFARGPLGGGADLYWSRRSPTGWSEPVALDAVNTDDADEITPWVSPDGAALLFATDRAEGRGGYDLWLSRFENDAWSAPEPLPASVNSSHNDYAPSLSPDGLWLWFASNRPRPVESDDAPEDPLVPPPSAGDYDLYRSGYAGASSTPPMRVEALCSKGDDVAPAWSPAGDFVYFASNREGGAGGFDLYRARVTDGSVSSPESLGAPINSPVDELDPALGMGGFELLFSAPIAAGEQDDRPDFDLLRSESREVYSVVDRSRSSLDWANLWNLFGPWLLWLALLLLLLFLLLKVRSSQGAVSRWRKLGLFARCLLLSVLIHALLLALLGVLRVSTAIGDYLEDGASRVRLTTSGGSVASQLRGGFEFASTTPSSTPSTRAQTSSAPAETTLARSRADASSVDQQQTPTQLRESSQAARVTTSNEASPVTPGSIRVQAPGAAAGDATQERTSSPLQHAQSTEIARADARSTSQGAASAALEPATTATDAQRAHVASPASATPTEQVLVDRSPFTPASQPRTKTPASPAGARAIEQTQRVAVQRAEGGAPRAEPESSGAGALTLESTADSTELAPDSIAVGPPESASSVESTPAPVARVQRAEASDIRTAPVTERASSLSEGALASAADQRAATTPTPAGVTGAIAPAPPSLVDAESSTPPPSAISGLAATDARAETLSPISSTNTIAGANPASARAPSESTPRAQSEANAALQRIVGSSSARVAKIASPVGGSETLSRVDPERQAPDTSPLVLASPGDAIGTGRVDPISPAPGVVARDVTLPSDTNIRAEYRNEALSRIDLADANPPERAGLAESPSEADTIVRTDAAPATVDAERTHVALALPDVGMPDVHPAPAAAIVASKFSSPIPHESEPAAGATESSADTPSTVGAPASPRARPTAVPSEQSQLVISAADPVRLELERTAAGQLADARAPDPIAAPTLSPALAPKFAPLAQLETAAAPAREPARATPLLNVVPTLTQARPDLNAQDSDEQLVTIDAARHTQIPSADSTALSDARPFDPQPMVSSPALPVPQLASAPMPVVAPVVEPVYPQRAPEIRQRLVERGGGSEETEKAVADALAWLARNQSRDGRWSSRGFEEFGGRSGDPARYDFDVASTGLALLCFFGADHTPDKPGPYQQTVASGLQWLLAREGEPGDFRQGESMYSQGIATIALCEGYAMTRDDRLIPPIERAIAYITGARNSAVGGWRYEPGQAGDTSVLGWMVMAMKSAQRCGVDVDPQAMAAASDWLALVMDDRWDGRYAYRPGMDATHSMTAEGMFVHQLLGTDRADPRMSGSARFVLQELPRWDAQSPTYAWYYATLALFQHGGGAWTRWNREVSRELVRAQRDDGPAAGSWDPTDRYARIGGRIYQTAICTLSLEVYYRYLPMYVDEPEVVGGE